MRFECVESSRSLRKLREARNLSQAKMAEIAGCSLRNYQNIEAGKTQPGHQILSNIVRNLPADPRELFEMDSNEENDAATEHIKRLLHKCNSTQMELVLKVIQNILETWPK